MVAFSSAVLLVAGTLTFIVGVVTIVAPDAVERANKRIFPGVEASQQRWRGIGLMAVGIGTILVTLGANSELLA